MLIALTFWIVALPCLVLDLANRLLGSYVRTRVRVFARSTTVIVGCLLFSVPLALAFAFERSTPVCVPLSIVLSMLVITHFLFPYRFGIRRIPGPAQSEASEPLTRGIVLRKLTVPLPHAGNPGPVRCLVLSDLHANTEDRLDMIRGAFSKLAPAPYDLILVLGDLGEDAALLPATFEAIASLQSTQGTYLVRGNHDCEDGRAELIASLAAQHGMTILSNAARTIAPLNLTLVGLDRPWIKTPLPAAPPPGLSVGLTHTPDNIRISSRLGVSLALAGHTHGGKLRLPLIGTILVPSRFGRFLDRGWFQHHHTKLYITPGLGYIAGRLNRKGIILLLTLK